MRQRPLRLTILFLAGVFLTSFVIAQPRPNSSVPASRLGILSGLAAFVPNDALFYASARSDAEAIAALNDVAADVTANLPDIMPPAPLESLIGDLLGVPFSEIDPWLGDGIAVAGVLSHHPPYVPVEGPYIDQPDTIELTYILHVTDADAAEVFLRSRGITSIAVYNDVLIFDDSDNLERADITGMPTLLDEPAYIAAIESFESRNYAGIVYADLPLLIAHQRGEDLRRYGSYYGSQQQVFEMAVLLRMFGPVAAGFTRGADGDLLMDVVVTAGNLNGIRPLGLNIQPPVPADPAMLSLAPSGTFAVLQGSNLSGGLVELYRAFGPMLKDAWAESLIQSAYRYGYTSPAPYEVVQDMDIFTLADLVLGNVLGLTLSDLQNWSSDDYVIFSRLNPDWPPTSSDYVTPVEVVGVFRIGRPEQSYAAFENLARTLQLWVGVSGASDYIDVDIQRISGIRQLDVNFYVNGPEKPGATLTLLVNENFAYLGSRNAVLSSLLGSSTSQLPEWLAEAAANLQPDSAFNGVFDPSELVHALPALMGSGFAEDVRPYIAKLDAIAFDLRVASNGATVMRFTLGFNDAGGIETALGRPTLVPPPTLPPLPTVMYLLPTPTPFIAPEATVEAIPETAMLTATWDAAFTLTASAPTLPPTWTPTPVASTMQFPTAPVMAEFWNLPSFRGEDGAFVLGYPDAPTTLVMFMDWACPHCQTLSPVIDEFIASDVASGAVNLEFRTLVTAGGDATRAAARLAECVELQKPGAFWSAYPALFGIVRETPNVYNDPALLAGTLGTTLNLDAVALLNCSETATQIDTDERYAAEIGANYTPFVGVRLSEGVLAMVNDRTLEGIREVVYGDRVAIEATPTPTPFDWTPAPTTDPVADATRAAELANVAATQAAAGQPTATATP